MYGLPSTIDLSFFHNQPLQSVGVGYNEAILRFGDDISLSIQTDIGHKSSAGEYTAIYKTIIPSVPVLVSLINSIVKRALAISPGTLALEFTNGETLEVYDTSSQYESYVIKHGGGVIVV